MEFKEILPFVRFVRFLEIDYNSDFLTSVPLDARIFYVTDGEGKIEIGSQIFTLPKGSLLYINAGCEYRLLPCEVVYLAINFDFTNKFSNIEMPVPPVNTDSGADIELIERVQFNDTVCFNEYFYLKDCHALQARLIRLEAEFTKKLSFYRTETAAQLVSVLTFIARNCEKGTLGEGRFDIERMISYIHENYSNQIDNRTLSEVFHFHPNYISAEFKRCVGKPLHRYVLETRIFNAVSLLESGNVNISQVAALTGFCDVNYFIRYFKKIMGTTPRQYIKAYRQVK